MICDRCHENEAVICYTEIIQGVKKELYLCESCAAKETGMSKSFAALTDGTFLSNLLAGVLSQDEEEPDNLRKTNIICSKCGRTYNEFLKYGTFGCPQCYQSFNLLLDSYLKNIQAGVIHTGKAPCYTGETIEIKDSLVNEQIEDAIPKADQEEITFSVDESSTENELRAALNRAVAREDYEEAARLRDLIKERHKGEKS